jgi:hypothetical protein
MKHLPMICSILTLIASGALAQDSSEAAARQAAVDASSADALAILKRSSSFLNEQKHFGFEADESYDTLQKNGMMIEFGSARSITVRRPDRLRIEVVERGGDRELTIFDGKTLSTFFEDEGAYIQLERSGSLDEIIDFMDEELGAAVPLSDFIHTNFYAEAVEEIQLGAVVGESTIAGTKCDHVVFLSDHAGFQLWIEKGSRPVPRRISIEFLDAPGAPQYKATLTNWTLGAGAPDESFVFQPPPDAERLIVRTAAKGAAAEGGK